MKIYSIEYLIAQKDHINPNVHFKVISALTQAELLQGMGPVLGEEEKSVDNVLLWERADKVRKGDARVLFSGDSLLRDSRVGFKVDHHLVSSVRSSFNIGKAPLDGRVPFGKVSSGNIAEGNAEVKGSRVKRIPGVEKRGREGQKGDIAVHKGNVVVNKENENVWKSKEYENVWKSKKNIFGEWRSPNTDNQQMSAGNSGKASSSSNSQSDSSRDISPKYKKKSHKEKSRKKPKPTRVLTEHKLSQRQKQIDYGYNTIGYQNYIAQIPKHERKRDHPRTPNKYQHCSKRSWDGQIRKWRRELHQFDPPEEKARYAEEQRLKKLIEQQQMLEEENTVQRVLTF